MAVFISKNKLGKILLLLLLIGAGCSSEKDNASKLYQEKKYSEAIPLLVEQVQKDSSNFDMLLLLADCYRLSDKQSKAIGYYEKCNRLQPNNFGVLVNLGDSYYKNGDTLAAENIFNNAMKIQSDSPELLYNLGVLYFNKNNFQLAIQYLSESVEKKESSEGYWILSKALLNKEELEPALSAVDIAIRLDASNASYYITKGIIKGKQENLKESISNFTYAILLDSSKSEAYYNRAFAYYLNGKLDSACSDINSVVRLGGTIDPTIQGQVCK